MDILEYLIDAEGEEDKGILAGMLGKEEEGWHMPGIVVDGETSLERIEVLMPAHTTTLSLVNTGIAAAHIFGTDIPDDIGEEIIAAIETVRRTIGRYRAGQADAVEVKAATKEGRAKASDITKRLTAARQQRHSK
jgi:hypothetical protein